MSRRQMFRAATALASTVAVMGGSAAAADASVHAHAAATSITVTASDYKFKLSKSSLPKPGAVTFKVVNKGKVAHDFKIDGKTTKMLSPGGSTTLKVTFKKGKFPYLCTVPGHAQLGMKGTFKVS